MSRVRPELGFALAALAVVAVEASTRSQERYGPECVFVALALVVGWKKREGLRARDIVVLAVAFPAAIAIVHLARGVSGDIDVQAVYQAEGTSLLRGTYPHSEYPPGAVVLFAIEDWVRSARSVNPFVMALCQGAISAALCSLRTVEARWLAAVVALWPVDAFFWEFKFDALPTALLVGGLAVALRERWALSGAILGMGAAVKWSPAVAAALLVIWLLAGRRRPAAARHVAGFSLAFLAITVPFLVWSPEAVLASVTRQAPRGITPESLWYLPLRLIGQARPSGAVFDAALVPHWTNAAAIAIQVLVLLALAAVLVWRHVDLPAAVAVAAVGPACFLLLNKVFSAQYVLTVLAAVCFGAALAKRPRVVAILLALAAVANVFVYPIGRFWEAGSLLLFAAGLAAALWVVEGAVGRSRYPPVS